MPFWKSKIIFLYFQKCIFYLNSCNFFPEPAAWTRAGQDWTGSTHSTDTEYSTTISKKIFVDSNSLFFLFIKPAIYVSLLYRDGVSWRDDHQHPDLPREAGKELVEKSTKHCFIFMNGTGTVFWWHKTILELSSNCLSSDCCCGDSGFFCPDPATNGVSIRTGIRPCIHKLGGLNSFFNSNLNIKYITLYR